MHAHMHTRAYARTHPQLIHTITLTHTTLIHTGIYK